MNRLFGGSAWRVLALGVAFLGATACGGGGTPADTGTLDVVTAFYPLEFVAHRVGGEIVSVANLTPPGAEPHDLELRPSDVRRIRSADLVLYFANGFQPALESAIEALPDKGDAVDLLSGLPLKPAPPDEEEGPTRDPHVWLSPPLMQRLVDRVADALAQRLPAKASAIRERAATLRSELTALDDEYASKLSHCARREIFTSHAAFSYLADHYGLRQVSITGISPEAEPSPKRLQEIADQARKAKATTIFFETLLSPRVSAAVARIVGAKTAVLDPIEGLSAGEAAKGVDYFSLMRQNLSALVEALGCAT